MMSQFVPQPPLRDPTKRPLLQRALQGAVPDLGYTRAAAGRPPTRRRSRYAGCGEDGPSQVHKPVPLEVQSSGGDMPMCQWEQACAATVTLSSESACHSLSER